MVLQLKKLLLGLAIAGAIVLVIDAWFPAVHFRIYSWGLLEPTAIDGKTISMKHGWYELANSKSGVGRLFFSAERETIWLAKADWPKYGRVNSLIIRKMKQQDIELYKGYIAKGEVPASVGEVRKFPWGTVLFGIDKTTAVIPDVWIFVTDEDPILFRQAIDEIEGFNMKHAEVKRS
jgi:hypothetical protein